jgi:hypothetical protein
MNLHPPDNLGDKRKITAGPGRPKGSKNRLTRERVEIEIRRIALSNIISAFQGVHGNTQRFTLRELRAMPEDFQRCIASIKVRTENLTAGDKAQDTTVEIKLWDKVKALELCARTLGMLKDKVEITVSEDLLARLDRGRVRAALPAGDVTQLEAPRETQTEEP